MKTQSRGKSLLKKLVSGSGWALFTMFVWELVEEGLESLIAYILSSAVAIFLAKALSTLAIITATQGIKVLIKKTLFPFIRELTYKEGNDKMEKIKQFFSWLNANKCTIGGIAIGAVTAISGAGVIDVTSLPELIVGSVNIAPILYYGILGILIILVSFFPETVEKFKERIKQLKAEAEEKAIEKEALKEIAEEEKLVNQTQAEAEKAQAKADAQAQAKEAKAQAEAEHRAKVEEVKAKILAERNTKNNS